KLANKLARAGKASKLYDYFVKVIRDPNVKLDKNQYKEVLIDKTAYLLIDPRELIKLYEKPHHSVKVHTESLYADSALRKEFMSQLRDHLSKADRSAIATKIKAQESLNLEMDLLPSFARKMVGK